MKNLKGINIIESNEKIRELGTGAYYIKDLYLKIEINWSTVKITELNKKEAKAIEIYIKNEYNKFNVFNNVFNKLNDGDVSVKNFIENLDLCDKELISITERIEDTKKIFNPFIKPKKVNLKNKLTRRKIHNAILTEQLIEAKYVYKNTDDYLLDFSNNFMKNETYDIGLLASELIESKYFSVSDNIEDDKITLIGYNTAVTLKIS